MISGPFTGGTRFRVFGLRAYLIGAKSLIGSDEIGMTIATSGLYYDVNKDGIWTFQMSPSNRTFRYSTDTLPDGRVIIDSIVANQDHVDPTPFTAWTVSVDPNEVDLAGLTDVKLVWQGNAYFNS